MRKNILCKVLPHKALYHSLTGEFKRKNGDFVYVEQLKDENIMVMTLADGSADCPCDWLSSRTVCLSFLRQFKELAHEIPIMELRIHQSILQANYALQKITGHCKGGRSSLTALVWQVGHTYVHVLNVGNPHSYHYQKGSLKRLATKASHSKDDLLGNESPTISLKTLSFEENEAVVLATSGFQATRGVLFKDDLNYMLEAKDPSSRFFKLMNMYSVCNVDDASMMVLKHLPQ